MLDQLPRERLEAACRAFAAHFSYPVSNSVLLYPEVFTIEALRVVVAFYAQAYANDLLDI